jgi:hypothetical protein
MNIKQEIDYSNAPAEASLDFKKSIDFTILGTMA